MHRREFLIGLPALGQLLTGCRAGVKYYTVTNQLISQGKPEEAKLLLEAVESLKLSDTTISFTLKDSSRVRFYTQKGCGVVLPNGYYITGYHVATVNSHVPIPNITVSYGLFNSDSIVPPSATIERSFNKIAEETSIVNPRTRKSEALERIVTDMGNEVALFRIPENTRGDYMALPLELGESKHLKAGERLYVAGIPPNEMPFIRKAQFTTYGILPYIKKETGENFAIVPNNFFVAEGKFNRGDSGALVIGQDMKVYGLVVGMVVGLNLGIIAKIDSFKPYLT